MSLADASDIADYYAKGMCVVCRGSRKEFSKVNFWNALLIKAARYTQKYLEIFIVALCGFCLKRYKHERQRVR